MKKNLANYITFFRFLSVFPLVYFLEKEGNITASIIYLVAALSDLVDGYVARKQKSITNLGTLMDPIADKLIYITSLIVFIQKGYISFLPVLLISFREIGITGLRSVCYVNGKTFPAVKAGKIKAFIQQVSFFIILFFKNHLVSTLTIYAIVLITFQSSYIYLINMFNFLKKED